MFFKRILKPVFTHETASVTTPDETVQNHDADILARTIWGEARGENLQGKEAVANVIINRLRHAQKQGTFWWGNTIETICKKPFQFSCWNKNDPNHAKLIAVTSSDAQFAICQRIALRAVKGILPDHTNGADHYHADYMTPKWAKAERITATIGRHIFYRLES